MCLYRDKLTIFRTTLVGIWISPLQALLCRHSLQTLDVRSCRCWALFSLYHFVEALLKTSPYTLFFLPSPPSNGSVQFFTALSR